MNCSADFHEILVNYAKEWPFVDINSLIVTT